MYLTPDTLRRQDAVDRPADKREEGVFPAAFAMSRFILWRWRSAVAGITLSAFEPTLLESQREWLIFADSTESAVDVQFLACRIVQR